jgi:hypothetical protein
VFRISPGRPAARLTGIDRATHLIRRLRDDTEALTPGPASSRA